MGDTANGSELSDLVEKELPNTAASSEDINQTMVNSRHPHPVDTHSDFAQVQMEETNQDSSQRIKQDEFDKFEDETRSFSPTTTPERTKVNGDDMEVDNCQETAHEDERCDKGDEEKPPETEDAKTQKMQAKEPNETNKSTKKHSFRIKHTIRVKVPDNVTIDLGDIMRSLRKRRLAELKKLNPHMDLPETYMADKSTKSSDENGKTRDMKSSQEKTKNKSRSSKDKGTDDDYRLSNSVVSKDKFGSVLDYLEAKYVKGVMVTDERQKKRKRKGKNDSDNDDQSVMSSESEVGSCYSDGNSFIDDSELKSEVAQQVMASSAYGTTRIEAEGGKGTDDKPFKDDNNAFFVNVGDLEMAEGWESEQDWKMEDEIESKKKKKKKIIKKRSPSQIEKTKKKIKEAGTSPKELPSSSKKRKRQEKVSPNKSSAVKKKVMKKKVSTEDTNTLFSISSSQSSPNSKRKSNKKTKKTPKKEKKEISEDDASESNDDNSNDNASESSSSNEKEDPKLQKLKHKSIQSYKKMRKYYKTVLGDIRDLTEEHLPRKPKKNKKVKVSIVVPQSKKPGDMITFSNPHAPGQKLKVKIPSSTSAGDKFVVSVPMPEVRRSTDAQNNIPRDVRDRLDEYSQVYDDWCTNEAKYRDLLPKKKGKQKFRAAVERLKKFDDLLKEFPKDLAHPIDASYLRKVVRRARQNSSKRRKLAMEKNTPTRIDGPKKKKKKVVHDPNAPSATIDLALPGQGTKFPKIRFNKADFAR